MLALEQNTPEWLEMRRSHIGASDAPVIMGVSPWKTPYQLWKEKMGLWEQTQTKAMADGKAIEENARLEFAALTELFMAPQIVQHPSHEWMIASLDGIDFSGKYLLEIKKANADDHQLAKDGKIPEKYIPQLQHQLACVPAAEKVYYFSCHGEDRVIVEVVRDEKYITTLIERELKFFAHMENLEAPPLSERDYIDKDDQAWLHTSASWLAIQEQLELLKSKEEMLREQLIALAGKSNCQGGGIRMTRSMRKGTVDYKTIPELKGVDLESYRKSAIESWRISSCV